MRSTSQGWVIKKCPQDSTTTNLPREDRPPKLTDQARRALIREAAQRPKVTLKELQSSTAETGVSVHRTTISCTLHRTGLCGRVAKKSHYLVLIIRRHVLSLPKGMWATPEMYGGRFSGQMRLKLSFSATKENAMSGVNPTHLITPRTPSPQ